MHMSRPLPQAVANSTGFTLSSRLLQPEGVGNLRQACSTTPPNEGLSVTNSAFCQNQANLNKMVITRSCLVSEASACSRCILQRRLDYMWNQNKCNCCLPVLCLFEMATASFSSLTGSANGPVLSDFEGICCTFQCEPR